MSSHAPMREVALSVNLPESWITRVGQKFSAPVRVIDCRPPRDGGIQQLVEICGRPEMLEQIVEFIRGDENVRDVHVVKTKRGRMLGVVATNDSTMCQTIADVNCFCLTCPLASPSRLDGTVNWVLAMTARDSLRKLIDQLKAHGIAPEIVRVTDMSDGEKLTARQRNIIEYALVSGFYEYPRRSSLQKLSRRLGVSSSSLGEMMRRAERKIIASYLRQAPRIGETDT